MTRRLRRERWGCRPERGSTFFRCERKYQRKPAARRLREKALYCPFWRRGSLCRAQRSWPATPAIVRARSSPFSAVKMGGPFSLRCLSPLCSPAVGAGQTQSMRVELLQCSLAGFAAQKNRLVFSLRLMLCLLNQRVAWDASSRLGYSCNTKGQRDFISTLVFGASHEARCRMAAFSIQQTRKPHQTGEP